MMNSYLPLILIVLISPTLGTFPSSGDISNIIQRLEKIVEFYQLSVRGTNLDGLFGLKVLEGVLREITGHRFLYNLLDNALQHRLIALLAKCQDPLARGIGYVKRNDPDQYANLKALITNVYKMNTIPRNIQPELKWAFILNEKDSSEVFDEAMSDTCIGDVIKAGSSSTCPITKVCAKAVTTRNLQSYALTHQLLYSMEAEKTPVCDKSWDDMLDVIGYVSNSEFQRVWCTNSYYEVLRLVRAGRTQHGQRIHTVDGAKLDLFYEHLFVCPSIGFFEFLKEEYLDIIFDAQDASGCYKEPTVKSPFARKPLMEQQAEDGCLFHLTAVACGALSSYLRYTLRLKYTPEKLNMDLLNDQKHYLEAVEVSRLKPSTSGGNQFSVKPYIIFVVVNVIFILLFVYKKHLFIYRRFSRKLPFLS